MVILRVCEISANSTSAVIRDLGSSYQILLGWAILACPAVGVLAIASPCPYQITAHMGAAATMTFVVLFLLPMVSPVSRSRKRKPSKPSYRKTYEDLNHALSKRFSSSLRMSITGCITACNLEFIMWHIEDQTDFRYNYEYLYCGYSATASLTSYLLIWMLRKRLRGEDVCESESEDETGWEAGSRLAAGGAEWWWCWEVGTVLLATQQLSAQLRPVWLLPPLLGALQGAGHVLSMGGAVRTTAVSYSVGYGCGCVAAGLVAQLWGVRVLFQGAGLAAALCAAVGAIVRGALRCGTKEKQSYRLPFPAVSESENSSDGEENEVGGTDDWLVQAMQQDEYRQAKKNQRLKC